MRQKENQETSVWISNTDLITGMLVIFLFLAVLLTQQAEEQKAQIEAIANESTRASEELKKNLEEAFTEEEQARYHLNKPNVGDVYFSDEYSKFAAGSANIPPAFQAELRNFLPKYIHAIAKCNPEYITEIRIEGHTSSEWDGNSTADYMYFKNMELSQNRTRAILNFAMSLPELQDQHDLIMQKLTANGLSSSQLRYKKLPNGQTVEDREASRRIEFKVVPNDKKTVQDIKKVVGIE